MSIYKRESGHYAALIDLEPTAAGLRRRKSLGTFATKKEAERAERDALAARDRGIDLDPQKVTVAEIATRFLKSVEPDLAGQTVSRYEEHLRMHVVPNIGSLGAASLKPAHLADLYAKLRTEPIRYERKARKAAADSAPVKVRYGRPLGATTVLRVHRLLHRMLGWAERLGLVSRNVARLVPAPKAGLPGASTERGSGSVVSGCRGGDAALRFLRLGRRDRHEARRTRRADLGRNRLRSEDRDRTAGDR